MSKTISQEVARRNHDLMDALNFIITKERKWFEFRHNTAIAVGRKRPGGDYEYRTVHISAGDRVLTHQAYIGKSGKVIMRFIAGEQMVSARHGDVLEIDVAHAIAKLEGFLELFDEARALCEERDLERFRSEGFTIEDDAHDSALVGLNQNDNPLFASW